jgi:exodeoxyribonuclease III
MSDDGLQGMLFGSLDNGQEEVGDPPGAKELRLCALNVNAPSVPRARGLVDWLLASQSNAFVLTELQPSDGGRLILSSLQAEGFTVSCGPGWQASRYLAAIVTRGFDATPVRPDAFDPRIVGVDLAAADSMIRLVGVYGPTNGMTTESSQRRKDFQLRLLNHLAAISQPAMAIAGDLNVVEPGHQPRLPSFESHDYAFYTGLIELGMTDAFRAICPDAREHSWISERFGAQRLDHTLIGPATGQLKECRYDHSPRTERLTDHAGLLTRIEFTDDLTAGP